MRTAWTAPDVRRAAGIYGELIGEMSQRAVCEFIGKEIGRTGKSVRNRLQTFGPSFLGKREKVPYRKPASRFVPMPRFAHKNYDRIQTDEKLLAERDRRSALEHREPTGFLMGDPKPGSGQSALEQIKP